MSTSFSYLHALFTQSGSKVWLNRRKFVSINLLIHFIFSVCLNKMFPHRFDCDCNHKQQTATTTTTTANTTQPPIVHDVWQAFGERFDLYAICNEHLLIGSDCRQTSWDAKHSQCRNIAKVVVVVIVVIFFFSILSGSFPQLFFFLRFHSFALKWMFYVCTEHIYPYLYVRFIFSTISAAIKLCCVVCINGVIVALLCSKSCLFQTHCTLQTPQPYISFVYFVV